MKTTVEERDRRTIEAEWAKLEHLAATTRQDGRITVNGRSVYDIEVAHWSGGRRAVRIWCETGKRGKPNYSIRVLDSAQQALEWLYGL